MPVWPDLASAVAELRTFLNDGPTDKPVKSKQVVGPVNDVNKEFITWDDRIIASTLRVTVDYVTVPSGEVTVTDAFNGSFTLQNAPSVGQIVRAFYYFQYFTDPELTEAMKLATGEVLQTEDPSGIPLGLKQTTLAFGGYFGFQKQAIRWAQQMSNRFVLAEEPQQQETMNRSNLFLQLSRTYFDQARTMRDDYYMRHSRRHAPAANMFKPNIPRPGIRR